MTFEEMEGVHLDLPVQQSFDEFKIEIVPLHGYYTNKKFIKLYGIKNRFFFLITVPDSFPFHPYKVRLISKVDIIETGYY